MNNNMNMVNPNGEMMNSKVVPSKLKMTILCLFLGVFGLHRFVMGYSNWWVMQLTFGGFGVWVIIDAVRIVTGSLHLVCHDDLS
jgi:TM2 domain-containing membrane protein YozV